MNEFNFEIINKLIKAKNVNYIDRDKNRGKLKNAIINVADNSIIGNEFEIDFYNSLFGNPLNEPPKTQAEPKTHRHLTAHEPSHQNGKLS